MTGKTKNIMRVSMKIILFLIETLSLNNGYYYYYFGGSCEFESLSWRGVFDTTLCDKY